jgi:hypothetical protein
MRPSLQRADIVAFSILGVLVSGVGTGIGVAAAHVRDGGGGRSAPLRVMLPGSNDMPSLQRDRVRFRKAPR